MRHFCVRFKFVTLIVFKIWRKQGFFQYKEIQTSPPLTFVSVLWIMGIVLYNTRKTIKKFFDFYFSSYRVKLIENWGDDVKKCPKNDQYSKNKNRKNLKFDFSFDSAEFGSFM